MPLTSGVAEQAKWGAVKVRAWRLFHPLLLSVVRPRASSAAAVPRPTHLTWSTLCCWVPAFVSHGLCPFSCGTVAWGGFRSRIRILDPKFVGRPVLSLLPFLALCVACCFLVVVGTCAWGSLQFLGKLYIDRHLGKPLNEASVLRAHLHDVIC